MSTLAAPTSLDLSVRHDVPAVEAKDLRTHLRELERHGADEVIVVLDPIDERSVGEVGRIVAAR